MHLSTKDNQVSRSWQQKLGDIAILQVIITRDYGSWWRDWLERKSKTESDHDRNEDYHSKVRSKLARLVNVVKVRPALDLTVNFACEFAKHGRSLGHKPSAMIARHYALWQAEGHKSVEVLDVESGQLTSYCLSQQYGTRVLSITENWLLMAPRDDDANVYSFVNR